MDGPGQIVYPSYMYHGKFERNLPIGKGVFSFDLKVLQHGYYVNIKDPKFDYIGAEEVIFLYLFILKNINQCFFYVVGSVTWAEH